MYRFASLFLFILLTFSSLGYTQNTVEFEKLTSENGISQSIVYKLQQDEVGNIWMATEEGVVKYNSVFSYLYTKQTGLPKEAGDRVSTLFIDSKNRVWIGVESGICLYNEKLDTFDYIETSESSKSNLVKSICEDVEGKIWIGAYNGLWLYDPETSEFTNKTFEKYGTGLGIQSLIVGITGKILLGTPKGLLVYDVLKETLTQRFSAKLNVMSIVRNKSDYLLGTKKQGLFKIDNRFNHISEIKLSKKENYRYPIRAITKDKTGNFYVATDGAGLYFLNNDYQKIDHFYHSEDNLNSLSSDGVYDLIIDKENIVWVATYGGGVNFLDKSKSIFKKIKHVLNTENSINNSFTRSIEVDKLGRVWFGTKKGISILDTKTNTWTHVKNIEDIVLAMESDGAYMWVGAFNKGVFRVDIKSLQVKKYDLTLKKVYSIFKDSKKNIWFGGIEGDLLKMETDGTVKNYPIRDVRSIIEFEKSILTAGRFGVSVIENDEITGYSAVELVKENLNYATTNVLSVFSENKILIGTNGAGLLIYDNETKGVHRLSTSSGLPSDIVQGIIASGEKEIWASTTRGLAQIILSETDTIIHVFDKNDGLASTDHNYGSYQKINEQSFAFGGVNGVSIFNPKEIKTKKNSSPNIFFDSFSIFNKVLQPEDPRINGHINTVKEIYLKYSENSITIKYVGVSHNAPTKIKYTWKLEGFSDDWSFPENNTQANFTNLNYGAYTFKVKSSDGFGEWGPERAIKITVLRPWWATNTAFVVYFLLVVGLFILTVYFTQLLVNKKSADEQIEFFNNLTHEIRTPLTILLSSLDTVSDTREQAANNQVKKTITRLNALFEQMLNFKKATSNNLLQNVTKLRLEEHIKGLTLNFKPLLQEYEITISVQNKWEKEVFYFDKETLNKIVFNLISNAVKYSKKGGSIEVLLNKKGEDELLIQVVDTGIGIPKDQQKFILKRFYRARNVVNSQKPGTGLGLMMVKNLVEKSNGTISFESVENKGTTFSVVLPNLQSKYKETVVLEADFQQEFKINEQTDIEEFSDRKILIVEDNNELRTLLARSLATYFQVYEASNGEEGFALAGQVFPDIILTDLIMPVLDGMQMAKKLLEDISLNHIPVFMMTVLNNSELKIESIESGISEYIEKPLDINLLLAKITNTLSWQNKLRKKFVHQSEKETATTYRNSKDEIFITDLEKVLVSNINDSSFSVHDLCEHVGMSRTSLYMKLKNLIDLSPQDFIIHTKLKHSKTLLIQGGLNVKEVAYQSGFSNPKYFSTSFKKFYGISPSGFLDSLGKNQA